MYVLYLRSYYLHTYIYTRTVYKNIITTYNYNDHHCNEGSWWLDSMMTYVKTQNACKTVLKHMYSYVHIAMNIFIRT